MAEQGDCHKNAMSAELGNALDNCRQSVLVLGNKVPGRDKQLSRLSASSEAAISLRRPDGRFRCSSSTYALGERVRSYGDV